jgi:glycosyltransferase involved in cell wall biosynthesis
MDGSGHIVETIQSILGQSGVAFDLMISDDRSEDETLALVRREAGDRARVAVNSERLGLAGNWNRCVALCHTPYVAIVHQDDLLLPGHLALHGRAFRSNPGLGWVASASVVIDEDGREVPETVVERGGVGPADREFAPGEAIARLAEGNPLRCSAVSIQVAAHADVGGFDPSFRYVVDWDFWVRVARRWPVAWRAEPTVAVRWHPASETHRFKTGTADLDETERLLDRLFGEEVDPTWPQSLAANARRKLARAYLNRAYVATFGGDGRLARRCLRRALALRPALIGRVAADPRLAARLAAVSLAPDLARRWLARKP